MTEMTTGKMLFVLAIVLGCFAVLWPKIFYPMMFEASNKSSKSGNFILGIVVKEHSRQFSFQDALPRPGPEFNHPAFRNGKGRPIFPGDDGESIRRTIERDLKVVHFCLVKQQTEQLLYFSQGPFLECVHLWVALGFSHKPKKVRDLWGFSCLYTLLELFAFLSTQL